jgi:hypothetical protein
MGKDWIGWNIRFGNPSLLIPMASATGSIQPTNFHVLRFGNLSFIDKTAGVFRQEISAVG